MQGAWVVYVLLAVFYNGDIFWKNVEKACQVFFWLFLKLILVGSY